MVDGGWSGGGLGSVRGWGGGTPVYGLRTRMGVGKEEGREGVTQSGPRSTPPDSTCHRQDTSRVL